VALQGFRKLDRAVMRLRLRRLHQGVQLCFAAEFFSLSLALEAGLNPQAIVYLSLEGINNCKTEKDMAIARRALPLCRAVCIASRERADGLTAELSLPTIQYVYLPVSWHKSRSALAFSGSRAAGEVKLVYSGYFAPWAQLRELVEAFAVASRQTAWTLTIHGHAMGTEDYLEQVANLATEHANISIDEAYYEDERYLGFLSAFDLGVALYSKNDGGSNWGNLSVSSGKIAAYCQAGLAVVTNLNEALTQTAPFLHVAEIDGPSLLRAVQAYVAQPEVYRESSLRLFDTVYDAAPLMQRLWTALGVPQLAHNPKDL
jgi:hypothetical protein